MTSSFIAVSCAGVAFSGLSGTADLGHAAHQKERRQHGQPSSATA